MVKDLPEFGWRSLQHGTYLTYWGVAGYLAKVGFTSFLELHFSPETLRLHVRLTRPRNEQDSMSRRKTRVVRESDSCFARLQQVENEESIQGFVFVGYWYTTWSTVPTHVIDPCVLPRKFSTRLRRPSSRSLWGRKITGRADGLPCPALVGPGHDTKVFLLTCPHDDRPCLPVLNVQGWTGGSMKGESYFPNVPSRTVILRGR